MYLTQHLFLKESIRILLHCPIMIKLGRTIHKCSWEVNKRGYEACKQRASTHQTTDHEEGLPGWSLSTLDWHSMHSINSSKEQVLMCECHVWTFEFFMCMHGQERWVLKHSSLMQNKKLHKMTLYCPCFLHVWIDLNSGSEILMVDNTNWSMNIIYFSLLILNDRVQYACIVPIW